MESKNVEIRKVVRGGVVMKGVVATRDLPTGEYIGFYPGKDIHDNVIESWILSYQITFSVKYDTAMEKILRYCMQSSLGERYCLIPTDPLGNVRREYRNSAPLFVNEPGPGEDYNVVWVREHETGKLHFYIFRPIPKGSELLTGYGDSYDRSYPITAWEPPPCIHVDRIR